MTTGRFLAVLRQRWPLVAVIVLLSVLTATALSVRQTPEYRATAQVYLSPENLAGLVNGGQNTSVIQQAERVASTQARLARVPAVIQATLDEVGVQGVSVQAFLSRSSVTANPDSDLLDFRVVDQTPAKAEALATAYGRQYTLYRKRLDTGTIALARQGVEAQLQQLRDSNRADSALYSTLFQKSEQLRTLETLQTSNALLVNEADDALKVRPKPARTAVVSFGAALVIAIIFAFLLDTLDTRVRSAEAVAKALALPVLGRIPAPRRRSQIVVLEDPWGHDAEPFRMLRTSVDFARVVGKATTLLITSSENGEGKSTTAANLAASLALAGERVCLVDLDLRNPSQHRYVEQSRVPGFSEVLLGTSDLQESLRRISLPGLDGPGTSLGALHSPGTLDFLPAGQRVPNPAEIIASTHTWSLVASLADRYDTVVIDSAPALMVAETAALASAVDGVLLVARLGTLRTPTIGRLRDFLSSSKARVFGLVVTNVNRRDTIGGRYGYSEDTSPAARRHIKRQ